MDYLIQNAYISYVSHFERPLILIIAQKKASLGKSKQNWKLLLTNYPHSLSPVPIRALKLDIFLPLTC